MEQPLPEGGQGGDVPRLHQAEGVFHPLHRQALHPLPGEAALQSGEGGPKGVHPDKGGGGPPGPLQYLQGGVVAVGPPPPLDQGRGDRILHRKGGELVPGGGGGKAPPDHGPEDAVDQPGGPALLQGLHQVHRLVHGGGGRGAGGEHQLVGPQPQRRPDLRLQPGHRRAGVVVQGPVQGDAALQHAIKEGGAKGPVPGGEGLPLEVGFQHQVGVAAVPLHVQEGGGGGLSWGHGRGPAFLYDLSTIG